MNADFIYAQLRVALVAGIAWAGGKGYFTPADSTLAFALVTSLLPIAAPWFASLYATWGTKKVPQQSIAIAASTAKVDNSTVGDTVAITGKVVGALLLGVIVFAPGTARAQIVVACDPQVLFTSKNLTPLAFIARIKACGADDVRAAIVDAESDPVDHAALSCLRPISAIQDGVADGGGLILRFQLYRRAKAQGLLSNCANYINSTIGLIR